MKKNLIIHIGHTKTGSSYIQSVLALNTELLASLGITYPEYEDIESARDGTTTGGHSPIFSNRARDLEDFPSLFDGKDTMLLSGEFLSRTLLDDYEPILNKLAEEYNLTVICFTRNVISHSISRWSQILKLGSSHDDIDTYLQKNTDSIYRFVSRWIDKSKELGFNFMLKNYSNHKHNMLETFCGLINLPMDGLKLPEQKVINRKLSQTENEYARLLWKISDQLTYRSKLYHLNDDTVRIFTFPNVINFMHEFPDIKAGKDKISPETYDILVDANREYVKNINSYLTEEERLEYGSPEVYVRTHEDPQPMPAEIVEILAERIVKFIRLRDVNIQLGADLTPPEKIEDTYAYHFLYK